MNLKKYKSLDGMENVVDIHDYHPKDVAPGVPNRRIIARQFTFADGEISVVFTSGLEFVYKSTKRAMKDILKEIKKESSSALRN